MSLQYKKLIVWQRTDDLFIAIHRRQLRRAARSVPSNIVEGLARKHTLDKLNF